MTLLEIIHVLDMNSHFDAIAKSLRQVSVRKHPRCLASFIPNRSEHFYWL